MVCWVENIMCADGPSKKDLLLSVYACEDLDVTRSTGLLNVLWLNLVNNLFLPLDVDAPGI